MSQSTLNRFILAPEHLKGLRNMKPSTYPAQPIDPNQLVSKALIQEIPKNQWEGDWLINLENDIKFLEDHFVCGVGDYLWIAETHRLNLIEKEGSAIEVWSEYMDGEKRRVMIHPDHVPFKNGRKLPPVSMRREACRFMLKVKEIETRWADPDKRTRLIWVVGIERMPDVDLILDLHKRGILQ